MLIQEEAAGEQVNDAVDFTPRAEGEAGSGGRHSATGTSALFTSRAPSASVRPRKWPGIFTDRARNFNASELQDEKMISLGRLAAGLAHELNNPASAVVRGAKLLMEGLADAEAAARKLGGAELGGRRPDDRISSRPCQPSVPRAWQKGGGDVLSPLARAERDEDGPRRRGEEVDHLHGRIAATHAHPWRTCCTRLSRCGRFAGLRLTGLLPDETTILNFRHLLELLGLGRGLFEEINALVAEPGYRVRAGRSWTRASSRRRHRRRTGRGRGIRRCIRRGRATSGTSGAGVDAETGLWLPEVASPRGHRGRNAFALDEPAAGRVRSRGHASPERTHGLTCI